jgi:hypothetical protein
MATRKELLKTFWKRFGSQSANPPLFFSNLSLTKRLTILTIGGLALSYPMFSVFNKGNYVQSLDDDYKAATEERRKAQLMSPLGNRLLGTIKPVKKEDLYEFYHGEETKRLQRKYNRRYEHEL